MYKNEITSTRHRFFALHYKNGSIKLSFIIQTVYLEYVQNKPTKSTWDSSLWALILDFIWVF